MKKKIYALLFVIVLSLFSFTPMRHPRKVKKLRMKPFQCMVYKPENDRNKHSLDEKMLLKELKRQHISHIKIVLAQAKLESANFSSHIAHANNNIFGIKHNGKYARYKSWKECVKDYKDSIQVKYHGGDYFSFLKKIHYSENPKYESILKNIIA